MGCACAPGLDNIAVPCSNGAAPTPSPNGSSLAIPAKPLLQPLMPIGNGSGCFLVACSAQKRFLAGGIEKVMSRLFLRIIIGTDAFQDYGLFMVKIL